MPHDNNCPNLYNAEVEIKTSDPILSTENMY